MAMAKTTLFLLGLLLVSVHLGHVQSQDGDFQDLQYDDSFSATSDEVATFSGDENNSDESTPASESFWTVPVDDVGQEPESIEESYVPAKDTSSGEDEPLQDDNVVMYSNNTFADGTNATSVNPDGFDLVEDEDESSTSTSVDDFSAASFASRYGCATGNPIDDCWRCDPNWASRRQSLANCAVGFGRSAIGGKNGRIYVVTSNRDDNPASPRPGTLRYAVTRPCPLWITFAYSMTIRLKNELMITSYKTIDGRGVTVRIAGGGGLTMQRVSNIIVHGIAIHDIKPTGPARIMSSTSHTGNRGRCDGDAISIFSSKNIWIDHCYFANAADGLIDVIRGSSGISITNNYFTRHDKVMLFGANKKDTMDRSMYVTVAYNKFGPGLIQRMPRVRFGNVHVVNNDYTSGWGMYAIAGSEAPTILSQGNVFNAFRGSKQVTKRINDGGPTFGGPKNWNWKSEGDRFLSGAFFTSVPMKWTSQSYAKTASCSARPSTMVVKMVRGAGPLNCRRGARC